MANESTKENINTQTTKSLFRILGLIFVLLLLENRLHITQYFMIGLRALAFVSFYAEITTLIVPGSLHTVSLCATNFEFLPETLD